MKRVFVLPMLAVLAVAEEPGVPPVEPAEAGKKIVAEAFAKLSAALAEAIAKDGPQGALPVCSEKAPQVAGQIAAAHGVSLRRATMMPRNPKNAADPAEQAALKTFADALAKREEPKPQVIKHPDGSSTFLAPIVIGNPLCLQCHGTPGTDVTAATMAAIHKAYPDDKAVGYKLGDLRGMWKVSFPPPAPEAGKPSRGE